jgi:hypothetical protein
MSWIVLLFGLIFQIFKLFDENKDNFSLSLFFLPKSDVISITILLTSKINYENNYFSTKQFNIFNSVSQLEAPYGTHQNKLFSSTSY